MTPKKRRRSCFVVLLLIVLTLATSSGFSDDAPPKTFFLPKGATAAFYILGRLSNKELIAAPRSEFVYVALLQRPGLERRYRLEALEGLAKLRNTDSLIELIRGLAELDKKGDEVNSVLRDLSNLLLKSSQQELTAKRIGLEKLAVESRLSMIRQIGYAAMVTADGTNGPAWKVAESNPGQVADLLRSIELIPRPMLRAEFYPRIEPLVHSADSGETQRAAIGAIVSIPGHEEETFATLASLVKAGTERTTAAASLQRIPRKAWRKEEAEPLIVSLMTYLKSVPVERRTEAEVVSTFQLANDLATMLSPDKARLYGKELRVLGVSVFVVRTIPEQMLYDRSLVVVEAGKPVEIILINEDSMPHNLVVVRPAAWEEVGQAAEKMSPEPDEQGRLYIPHTPQVLFATRLVEPGQQVKLSFIAPTQAGDYPYVCTFPGHWRRMVGTLAVVKDVEAYLADRNNLPKPALTEWKMEDLAPELGKVGPGRNLARGRELFTQLACAGCHKFGKEGVNYGPDLTDVLKRYQGNRAEVLRQIIEPSLVISNRYRSYQMELRDGETVTGMIMKEDTQNITLQTGPLDALVQVVSRSEIKSQKPQVSSPMPIGLLNTLSKEEIFDLMVWLELGSNAIVHEHQR